MFFLYINSSATPTGSICRLKNALYGLKQANQTWHAAIVSVLLEIGFQLCPSKPCVYHFTSASGRIYLGLYVDDILVAVSSLAIIDQLIIQLKTKFQILTLVTFLLSWHASYQRSICQDFRTLSSSLYWANASSFHMSDANSQQIPLLPSNNLCISPAPPPWLWLFLIALQLVICNTLLVVLARIFPLQCELSQSISQGDSSLATFHSGTIASWRWHLYRISHTFWRGDVSRMYTRASLPNLPTYIPLVSPTLCNTPSHRKF